MERRDDSDPDVGSRIADGRPVDWDEVSNSKAFSAEEVAALRQLHQFHAEQRELNSAGAGAGAGPDSAAPAPSVSRNLLWVFAIGLVLLVVVALVALAVLTSS